MIAHGAKQHGAESEDDAAGEGLTAEVDASLAATRAYWEAWSDRCTYEGPYRESVLRSALTLKLLTHGPSGGIVAAATAAGIDVRLERLAGVGHLMVRHARLWHELAAEHLVRTLLDRTPGATDNDL